MACSIEKPFSIYGLGFRAGFRWWDLARGRVMVCCSSRATSIPRPRKPYGCTDPPKKTQEPTERDHHERRPLHRDGSFDWNSPSSVGSTVKNGALNNYKYYFRVPLIVSYTGIPLILVIKAPHIEVLVCEPLFVMAYASLTRVHG